MILNLIYKLRSLKIICNRLLIALFYTGKNFKVGKKLNCEKIPRFHLTDQGTLKIKDNVILKEGIEIRVHKNAYLEIGNNCKIDKGVRILATNNSRIIIKDNVKIGLHSVFNGGDSITIGKQTLISGFVYLQTSMHNYKKTGYIQNQGYSHAPIIIGEDNWLGAHAVIFPGVNLGKGCIVGSNAVVTKSFNAAEVIVGVAASSISKRKSD